MLTLKLERIRAGLTQKALADRAGLSQTRVSLLERALTEATQIEREVARVIGESVKKLFQPIASLSGLSSTIEVNPDER